MADDVDIALGVAPLEAGTLGEGDRDVAVALVPAPLTSHALTNDRARGIALLETGGGGPTPPPTPAVYVNRGWCTTHTTVETWETTGAPGPAPGGHVIAAGSASFVVLP